MLHLNTYLNKFQQISIKFRSLKLAFIFLKQMCFNVLLVSNIFFIIIALHVIYPLPFRYLITTMSKGSVRVK